MMLSSIFLLSFLQIPVFDEPFSFGYSHPWEIADPDTHEGGPSKWHVVEGVLHQSSPIRATGPDFLGTRFFLERPDLEDGTWVVRIASQDRGGIALLFRVQDENHYYRFLLLEAPNRGSPLMRLDKREGNRITILAEEEAGLSYPFGLWWYVAVAMEAGRFNVQINGEPVLSAEDVAYSYGGVGVEAWSNAGVRVDHIALFEGEPPSYAIRSKPALLKGPHLWRLEPTSAHLTWETSLPLSSVVELSHREGSRRIEADPEGVLFHQVRIDGLVPDTPYTYRITSDPVLSPLFEIRTPPIHPDRFRFCVYGNSHSDPDTHRLIIRSMSVKQPDFVLHVGDMVAGGHSYEEWLPMLFGPADWLLHAKPFYLCPGDHEKDARWYDTCTALPGNGRYYDFTHGTAYFLALDSNRAMDPGSPQHEWLSGALASEAAEDALWRIGFFHHLPRSTVFRDHIIPLLEKAGFDLLFCGEHGWYQRQKVGRLHLANTGGGGAPLDFEGYGREEPSPQVEMRRCLHHACLVEVEGRTLKCSAFTPDSKPFDTLELKK
jgi:hypothetical protein